MTFLLQGVALIAKPAFKAIRWLWERKAASYVMGMAAVAAMLVLSNRMYEILNQMPHSFGFLDAYTPYLSFANYAMPLSEAMAMGVVLSGLWVACAAYKWISSWA